MKKIILMMILTLMIGIQNLVAEEFKHSLHELTAIASQNNDIDILLSNDINVDDYTFFTNEFSPNLDFYTFKKLLNSKNLNIYKFKNHYIIDKINDESILNNLITGKSQVKSITLNNYVASSVLNILKLYNVKSYYDISQNKLYYVCNYELCYDILSNIKSIDNTNFQSKIKITVFETNLKNIKERGSEISSYFKSLPNNSFNYFFNLITMPYNATSNVTSNSKAGFYGVLKFLDDNGLTTIKSSPFLLLRSGKETYFSSVENIPYLTKNQEFQDNKKSTTNSYEYKDVGLKITINPVILKDNSIDFDLDFTLEDLINYNNDKPITSKKQLKGSYILKKGDLLILSGINKNTTYKSISKVPLLSDIWLIGNLFKYQKIEKKDTTLTISVEIL